MRLATRMRYALAAADIAMQMGRFMVERGLALGGLLGIRKA